MMGRNEKEETIQGTIFPAGWDGNENVVRIIIDTTDEGEYYIDLDRKGKDLLKFLHQKVELTGTIREEKYGDLVIKVTKYKPL
jgi:hypothetical protein